MSKGIGDNYMTDKMVKWHKANLTDRMYCSLPDGKKVSMPRYYKDKIYSEMERKRISHFQKLEAIAEQQRLMIDENYFAEKAEADLFAFRREYSKQDNRNKI